MRVSVFRDTMRDQWLLRSLGRQIRVSLQADHRQWAEIDRTYI